MTPTSTQPTHFDLLGLPARFALDLAEIERNYLATQPGGPSRTITSWASSSEQRASMEHDAPRSTTPTPRCGSRSAGPSICLACRAVPSAAEYKEMARRFWRKCSNCAWRSRNCASGPADSPGRTGDGEAAHPRSDGWFS